MVSRRPSRSALFVALTLTAMAYMQASRTVRADSETGASLFNRIWTSADGLGPLLNAQSCVACHAHPAPGGTSTKRETFVLVSPDSRDSSGSRVFQVFRMRPNGLMTLRTLPRQTASRKPPSLFGLGLLEAMTETSQDETSIPRPRRAGRFGWKNSFPTIDEAVATAFANEMGLLAPAFAAGDKPEISHEQVSAVAQFIRSLPAPPPSNDQTTFGKHLFITIGCASCHSPMQRTGDSPVPALRNRTFEPYTDLLMHDMGRALSDGWDDGSVLGSAFRTPPLWGLSQSGPPYLHDGRADTIERAIELHGGEAEKSVSAYYQLSLSERARLLRFLQSL